MPQNEVLTKIEIQTLHSISTHYLPVLVSVGGYKIKAVHWNEYPQAPERFRKAYEQEFFSPNKRNRARSLAQQIEFWLPMYEPGKVTNVRFYREEEDKERFGGMDGLKLIERFLDALYEGDTTFFEMVIAALTRQEMTDYSVPRITMMIYLWLLRKGVHPITKKVLWTHVCDWHQRYHRPLPKPTHMARILAKIGLDELPEEQTGRPRQK